MPSAVYAATSKQTIYFTLLARGVDSHYEPNRYLPLIRTYLCEHARVLSLFLGHCTATEARDVTLLIYFINVNMQRLSF